MNEHSPLPWHFDGDFIKDADSKIVDMSLTNACFILTAVNSHDPHLCRELLAAAKALISALEKDDNYDVWRMELADAIARAESLP
jgi:hypothetical protein